MSLTSDQTKVYFHDRARQFDSLYNEERNFDYYFNRIFRRALYDRVRFTVEAFEGMHDFSVLDIGSGSGRNSVIFAKSGARRVLGVDFAENMVSLARDHSILQGEQKKCEFVKANAMEYPFTEKFDAVAALGVLDYVAEPVEFLRRMASLADKKVIASFPSPSLIRAPLRKLRYSMRDCPVFFYSRKRLQEICKAAGLTDYKLIGLAHSGYLLVASVN